MENLDKLNLYKLINNISLSKVNEASLLMQSFVHTVNNPLGVVSIAVESVREKIANDGVKKDVALKQLDLALKNLNRLQSYFEICRKVLYNKNSIKQEMSLGKQLQLSLQAIDKLPSFFKEIKISEELDREFLVNPVYLHWFFVEVIEYCQFVGKEKKSSLLIEKQGENQIKFTLTDIENNNLKEILYQWVLIESFAHHQQLKL